MPDAVTARGRPPGPTRIVGPAPYGPGMASADPPHRPGTELTARQLNRATLARQLLLAREPLDVRAAVRRVLALQAQEPASPYLALWNRVADFDPTRLDTALTRHTVVKATLMRITLHAVDAADHPPLHEAMLRSLRAARLGDARFTGTGLATADADALVPTLAAFAATPRTVAECRAHLTERVGEPAGTGAWWALRTVAPLLHAPTGGAWSFGPRPSYVAAASHCLTPPGDPDASRRHLVRRYLAAFGPASVADVAQFTLLSRSVVREALAGGAADALEQVRGPAGGTLYDVPGAPLPDGDTPAPPRLLGMWDSVLLAYADRSRLIPPGHRPLVIRRNGDVLPTLLVDGLVAGVWRPVEDGIEATAFHSLPVDAWAGLGTEARALRAFLADRDPAVYRRYAHWWATLPAAEVRVLR